MYSSEQRRRAQSVSNVFSAAGETRAPAHRELQVALGAPDKEGWDGWGEWEMKDGGTKERTESLVPTPSN